MNKINKDSENKKCCICGNVSDLVKVKGKEVCKECIKGIVKLK